jgi:ABC-type cobalt transport system substrate-binding protein
MKRLRTLLTIVVLAAAPLWCRGPAQAADAGWQGVDDKFEELAKAAGHPAREPYINLVQGDVGLFMFLMAGALGGFIAGYNFRILFPPRSATAKDHASNS